jgi:hypothetical protein
MNRDLNNWEKTSAIASILSSLGTVIALISLVISIDQLKNQDADFQRQFAIQKNQYDLNEKQFIVQNKKDSILFKRDSITQRTFLKYYESQYRYERYSKAPMLEMLNSALSYSNDNDTVSVQIFIKNKGGRECDDINFNIYIIDTIDVYTKKTQNRYVRFISDTIANEFHPSTTLEVKFSFKEPYQNFYVVIVPNYWDYFTQETNNDSFWILHFNSNRENPSMPTGTQTIPRKKETDDVANYFSKIVGKKKAENVKYGFKTLLPVHNPPYEW